MFQNPRFAFAVAAGAVEREGIARGLPVRVGKQDVAQSPVMQIAQFERGVTQLHRPVRADPNQLMGVTRHLHVGTLEHPVWDRVYTYQRFLIFSGWPDLSLANAATQSKIAARSSSRNCNSWLTPSVK